LGEKCASSNNSATVPPVRQRFSQSADNAYSSALAVVGDDINELINQVFGFLPAPKVFGQFAVTQRDAFLGCSIHYCSFQILFLSMIARNPKINRGSATVRRASPV
jgi:hypothetical protein